MRFNSTAVAPILLLAPLCALLQGGEMAAFSNGARILFQGDSITDGNRGRTEDPNHILGHGYAFVIAARYGAAFPDRHLVFLNRGVSGNTVANLAARWQADTVDLKPDVLSILVGVNDLNMRVPLEQFEAGYDELLASTVKALPDVKLVLGEPFALKVGRYNNANWDDRMAEMRKRQAVVAKLAAKYHAALALYQQAFDEACKRAPADYWIWDGIHPTYSGHQIMVDEWTRVVDQFWASPVTPRKANGGK
jgi:lysophospholipase L1-like esterase